MYGIVPLVKAGPAADAAYIYGTSPRWWQHASFMKAVRVAIKHLLLAQCWHNIDALS